MVPVRHAVERAACGFDFGLKLRQPRELHLQFMQHDAHLMFEPGETIRRSADAQLRIEAGAGEPDWAIGELVTLAHAPSCR
jgi:hypothetical protein